MNMEQQTILKNVLLIDDDDTTNHVNNRLLVRSGLVGHVEAAINGQQALDYLSKSADSPPQLILLDLQMDGMDGFTFLELYKQLPAEKKAKALIALTSSASFYDLTRLKEFPEVLEHLFKPFTQEHLDELIDKYFQE